MSSQGKRHRNAARRRGDGWRCHYCDRHFGKDKRTGSHVTTDHIIPRCLGGPDAGWNRVLCCPPCNRRKNDSTYEEFTGKDKLPPQCWPYATTTAEFVPSGLL